MNKNKLSDILLREVSDTQALILLSIWAILVGIMLVLWAIKYVGGIQI